jgi:microcin C transport system substrate-binding protein
MRRLLILLSCWLFCAAAYAEDPPWEKALTLFGEAAYPAGFTHFDYVNPKAPKGGRLKMASSASFDSVNGFIMRGVKAPGLNYLYDTLMARALDEPQSYYPLLAKRFRQDPKNRWIEFELNEEAKWHDGRPITVEDVIWSLETLKTKGDPVYRFSYLPLASAEKTGPSRVKIHFADDANREAPILIASMPVLPKHYYQDVPFEKTTLNSPLGSGPYRIAEVDVGRSIQYERVDNYWAKDLPVNRGQYNFDSLVYDVYRDSTVQLEALKAGEFDIHREFISRNWATAYDFPAIEDGRILKTEIPDNNPQGMQAFFFNLRQSALSDRAVRQAIALTMDFEWTNKQLFFSAYARNSSFFLNTSFAADGLPDSAEQELLTLFADQLPSEIFSEIPKQPHTDGSGQNRDNLLKAQRLLNEAGYLLKDGKRIHPNTGEPLSVEFMLNQPTMQRVILPMLRGLKKLGIAGNVRLVDDAQYQRRIETRDFDIVSGWINHGVFFPGIEQYNYWHSSQAEVEGSNNLTGLTSPAADAMIERILSARTMEELTPAARALDRILLHEQVVIPHWHSKSYRMAFWNKFGRPEKMAKYGIALDSWWMKTEKH